MTKARFTEEFKEEAVKQVIERSYTVPNVASRLGVPVQSLYKLVKACAPDKKERYVAVIREVRRENLRLKAEMQQVREDREILIKAAYFAKKPGLKYAFILQNRERYRIRRMCRALGVSRSGYYAWLVRPSSKRSIEDRRLLQLIQDYYEASGKTYGAPRIRFDLLELGERLGRHRVARIMRVNNIRAQRGGYKRPGYQYYKPAVAATNRLQ